MKNTIPIFKIKKIFLDELGSKKEQLSFFENYQLFEPQIYVKNNIYVLLVYALNYTEDLYNRIYYKVRYSRNGIYDPQKTISFDEILSQKQFTINHIIIQYTKLCEEDHIEAVADTAAAEDAALVFPTEESECGNY